MKKINIAIIGLGHWGKNYLRVIDNIPGAKTIQICDINQKKFQNIQNFTANFKDVLKNKKVDAVVISTIAKSHFQLAKQSLINGKHVLVEKPITTDVKQAEILNNIAKKKNLKLMVGHTFLYNSSVIKLKNIIKNEIAGKIYYINCRRTHLGLIRNDVDVVWDLAPHDVSILNFITNKMPISGKIKKIYQLKKGKADAAFIHLEYPSKIFANIHVSWLDSNKTRTVEIIGSKARILFDDINLLEPIKIFKKGVSVEKNDNNNGINYNLRDGEIISPKINLKEPLYQMCLDFVDSIKKKKKPLSDFNVGYNCIKVLKSLKNF